MIKLSRNIELFREAIKHRRIELGMSQLELAEKVGYKNASTISKIERGVICAPYAKINIFSNALKTSPENLISNEELSGRLFEGELIQD
jgi:transcriptional regulator with XRE-family HTH domain